MLFSCYDQKSGRRVIVMTEALRYTPDTMCQNCGHWFAIIEYPNRCPECNSQYIEVKKIGGPAGRERPISAIEMAARQKEPL